MDAKATDDEIVGFIRGYREEMGFSPSVRDIVSGLGYRSTGSVKHRLERLRDEGRVTYVDRVARTLREVGDGD